MFLKERRGREKGREGGGKRKRNKGRKKKRERERGGEENLTGDERGKTVIRIYCIHISFNYRKNCV